MKIKLKDKPIRRGNSYGGFGVEISTILNSGGIVEIEQIPEVSKDLVIEVTKQKKEINDGD